MRIRFVRNWGMKGPGDEWFCPHPGQAKQLILYGYAVEATPKPAAPKVMRPLRPRA